MNIKFNYKNFAKDVFQLDAFIDDYSNNPEQLAKIVRELVDVTCFISYSPAPWDENGIPRLKSNVELTYKGKTLRFDFWHSIADTIAFEHDELDSKFLGHVLYDLLCTIGSDAQFCDDSFKDFCDASGYDSDSHRALVQYKAWRKFAKAIMGVFDADELACFPS